MPIVDVAEAETVVALLGFPECILDMVVLALLDAGCDARAAILIAKYRRDSKRNWVKMAVRALLGPGDEALTRLCRRVNGPWGVKGVAVGRVAKECARVLTQAGRGGVAAVLESEFPVHGQSQHPDVDEAAKADGRCIAAKLRRCAPPRDAAGR
jgi:hypothetical protein